MGRKRQEGEGNGYRGCLILTLVFGTALFLVCVAFRGIGPAGSFYRIGEGDGGGVYVGEEEEGDEECCRGVEHLELWGSVVKWGSNHVVNTSGSCCKECRKMCDGKGPCLCNSWVFCGNKEKCGDKYGQCWLKKQKDILQPEISSKSKDVIWTSGLLSGKAQGILGLQTPLGTIRIQLFPECAPYSAEYIIDLLKSRHCFGCQIHRAEARGPSWDSEGNHISGATYGPPFALLQGTLESDGVDFTGIPKEACPLVTRGSVAWIGSGPEFFISLANHVEWRRIHTVFGSVLPQDMEIAEKISQLPTKTDVWSNIQVSILEKPLSLKVVKVSSISSS